MHQEIINKLVMLPIGCLSYHANNEDQTQRKRNTFLLENGSYATFITHKNLHHSETRGWQGRSYPEIIQAGVKS